MKIRVSIFMAAAAIRLLALWLLPEPHLSYNAAFTYLRGAQILLEGEGFSDVSFPVYTPPLYSMCIAMVTYLFGDGIIAIKVLQIVADSLTTVILYVIIEDLFDRPAGYLSAMIWALYPFAIYSALYIGTEAFFTFLIALWVLLTVRVIRSDRWQYHCGAGVILGLATLTRGTTQFLPLLLPFVLFAFRKQSPGWWRGYLLSLLCFIVVILPWGVRNYLVLHEVIAVGSNNTMIFYGVSERLWTIGDEREMEKSRLYSEARAKGIVPPSPDSASAERERFLIKLAIDNYVERLRTDPVSLVPFMVKKFSRLWYSTESGNNHVIILSINALIYAPAIVGVVAFWRRKKGIVVLLLSLIGYFVLLHWLTVPLFRYMVPVMPYVAGFAALGLLIVLGKNGQKRVNVFSDRAIECIRRANS